MKFEKELKQGTEIYYYLPKSGKKWTGKIVGIASGGFPFLGRTYIIEPNEPFANETYPYSHHVLFEIDINLVDSETCGLPDWS